MTKEEYDNRRNELFKELAELKEQYIRDNTVIPPGTEVVAAGIKCWLRDYTVVNGRIYPNLFKSRGVAKRIHVSANAKIEKYEEK